MKNNKFINSFKYAFIGIKSALQSERNMKIHLLAMILVIIFGFIYQISIREWIDCLFCFGLVISAEMMNTAIEACIDLAMPDIHPMAKLAKDVAAGAVLVTAIIASIIGMLIFVPKIFL